ncbi:alanine racemase [Robiginitalea myxolifaciens]|uniref:Alanine racemase n=1 Tax=Robiginitalea myxolifaciens TaxID=400055 RepID=A0A1I6G4K3_9FLAO|nr:alanine racemase [Robiginitalea myxolifaciens]SFR37119.1 alanine racemase [Robiginitalea myxolifaciens]
MSVDPLTCLEIDLDALEHNYHFLRSRLKPETNFLGVVKAYAYGSDSIAIARKLEALGADYLAVAFTREGIHLREAGISLPILVLHPQPADLKFLAEHRLEPNLYSPRLLKLFLSLAGETGLEHYPVHLEFNTGLNRVGFWENDVDWIAEALEGSSAIEICSVFSHLAASDDPKARDFTLRQIESFAAIVREVATKLPGKPFKHLLNTSGVLNYPEGQWDMVRCGIGLYGYGNAPQYDNALRPVARLRTHISQLHLIEPGEYVGYNMGYQSPKGGKIATLPVGHADGIGRQYGQERGSFIIGGQRAPIIGNVCMDMVMVEVSGIPCKEGDQALFFGPEISAETQASQAGTISYELLTGISQRIRREIIGG